MTGLQMQSLILFSSEDRLNKLHGKLSAKSTISLMIPWGDSPGLRQRLLGLQQLGF